MNTKDDGCFKLGREDCCNFYDGRDGSHYSQPCALAKDGMNFNSNVCEPESWVHSKGYKSKQKECPVRGM